MPLQILVVDDHGESADALARLLRREGHQVTVAYTMVEALSAAARLSGIDVLLCDIGLPDGSGCDVLRVLHDRRRGRPRLAVALTGFGEQEWRQECRRAGFTQFLMKPILFEHVIALIAGVRPHPAAEDSPVAAPLPNR